jgi:hypothetical protein
MFENFVTLVMMTQYDDPFTECLLGTDDTPIAILIV